MEVGEVFKVLPELIEEGTIQLQYIRLLSICHKHFTSEDVQGPIMPS